MLELIFITILLIGFYFFKLGLIDRKAELTTFIISAIMFSVAGFSALNIQIVVGNELQAIQNESLFIFFIILSILSFALAMLSAFGKLPRGVEQ